jgi:lysophospholipase L1-like esterase
MRGRRRTCIVGAAAATALGLSAGSTAADTATAYYVSLGDSLARGAQPDRDGRNRETDEGYVDDVARSLRRSRPGLRTVKLGCNGETLGSMLSGGHCTYAGGSQLRAAEAFLTSHRGQIRAVTVNIGDNDVEPCLTLRRVDEACVRTKMSRLRARLPQIARRLRTAAGPATAIVGLTDYDQFLAAWLRGRSGRRVARRSVAIVVALDRAADRIYRAAGLRVADATAAFRTTDLGHSERLAGHGRVPVAVDRICAWTWACSGPPVGFNDHANARGYRVLARVALAGLRAP